MRPLLVTAEMLDGRVIDNEMQLPLDSFLAYAWMVEHHPELMDVSRSGIPASELITPKLPLALRGHGDDWYWAASWAFGEPLKEQTVYVHKRFDDDLAAEYVDFQGRRGTVNVQSGYYKAQRKPNAVFLVPRLWWCCVGNKDEVERLLRHIPAIGKRRNIGFGRVREWRVEYADEDLSDARAIPDEQGSERMGIRPPYWLNQHYRQVRWPDHPGLAANRIRAGVFAHG